MVGELFGTCLFSTHYGNSESASLHKHLMRELCKTIDTQAFTVKHFTRFFVCFWRCRDICGIFHPQTSSRFAFTECCHNMAHTCSLFRCYTVQSLNTTFGKVPRLARIRSFYPAKMSSRKSFGLLLLNHQNWNICLKSFSKIFCICNIRRIFPTLSPWAEWGEFVHTVPLPFKLPFLSKIGVHKGQSKDLKNYKRAYLAR